MPMFTVYEHQIKTLDDGGKIDVFTVEQETYYTQFLDEEKLQQIIDGEESSSTIERKNLIRFSEDTFG